MLASMASCSESGCRMQILERADQIIAIAGELAAEFNLVAERPDLPFVVRQHPQDELLGCGLEQIEIRRHARAEVQHDDHREWLRLVLEERDLLRLPVVENRELFLFQVRDEPSLRVDDCGEHRDDAGPRLESRLLREYRDPCQDRERR